jgi:3-deoxy-D-manno-octulosonic-acid transferase
MPGCVRRSRANGPGGDSGATGTPRADRFLLDTIGELRAAYALADVVVLGRSFGRLFGSDPVEPAALGKPVLMGPRYRDFDSATRALAEAGGLRLVTREELGGAIEELLRDPAARRAMGAAARACVAGRRGATARHAELLWRAAGVGAGG